MIAMKKGYEILVLHLKRDFRLCSENMHTQLLNLTAGAGFPVVFKGRLPDDRLAVERYP